MPTIDHDPREPSRKALKLIAILTVVITLAVMIPVSMGIRWSADQLPREIFVPLFFVIVAFVGGFFFGRWDATRQFRTPNRDG